MTNLPTVTTPKSVTRFSEITLNVVDRFRSDIDTDRFMVASPLPNIDPAQIDQAVHELKSSLAPCGAQAARDVIVGLSTITITRREDLNEAKAVVETLVQHFQHCPIDLLRKGRDAYVAVPGERFFPRSPGELNEFVAPLVAFRQRAIYRLGKIAEAIRDAKSEAQRLAEVDEIPDDEILGWPTHSQQAARDRGWIPDEQWARIEAQTTTNA